MEIKYIANDGTSFTKEKDCLNYELMLTGKIWHVATDYNEDLGNWQKRYLVSAKDRNEVLLWVYLNVSKCPVRSGYLYPIPTYNVSPMLKPDKVSNYQNAELVIIDYDWGDQDFCNKINKEID